ncbi:MAG: RelA/SpoT family protein [bacterium]|nr:RelA/SpoT family protein [bacterium]
MNDRLYQKALEFATLAHAGQTRFTGEPFVDHAVAVAETLKSWQLDDNCVIAGLLHDTVENGGATREDILAEFGDDVTQIIDRVAKITAIHLKGSNQAEFVENLRKMILVMAADLRVVLVKLADRLHNMQSLSHLFGQAQAENARETLEIYAPLAERLGMGEIKGQLEDLAFPYVYPDEYHRLVSQTQKRYQEGSRLMQKFKKQLLVLLKPKLPKAQIDGRQKRLYSLWRKLQRPEIDGDLAKIYDLVAARVLVDTVEECYLVLGAIHSKWHPVPYLGVSDFIANPKPNGYRSIHTKIFGPEGQIVEVQIRSHQMHQQAEMGIAAHWNYAETKAGKITDRELETGQVRTPTKLTWVKQLASWQKELADSQEYFAALKFDALQHRNLVFSPIGDVYDLPAGATPVDYAFTVHTKLGTQAIGAKVNGKLVPLNHRLVNGDVVEILVDRNRTKPNRDWLSFVVTAAARHAISKSFKQ